MHPIGYHTSDTRHLMLWIANASDTRHRMPSDTRQKNHSEFRFQGKNFKSIHKGAQVLVGNLRKSKAVHCKLLNTSKQTISNHF